METNQWTSRVATTLAAWAFAFAIVITLLTLFGKQLGALPPALRALVLSGTLVTLMVNVVMPFLGPRIARSRFASRPVASSAGSPR